MDLFGLAKATDSFASSWTFLQEGALMRRTPPPCPEPGCTGAMKTVPKKSGTDPVVWRCNVHFIKRTIRTDSFFAGSHLSLQVLVMIMWLWSFRTPVTTAAEMTSTSVKTIIQWYAYFRDVCSHRLLQHPRKIGGPGVKVEIDESVISRRKYHVGHLIPERWVFGGYCPSTQEGFLRIVPDRRALTLLPIIQDCILPGSIINSDCWAAYHNISSLPVHPAYQHVTVNHSTNFTDPLTGANTNHVECYWKNVKRRFKYMCGVHTTMLESHLDEFLWREIYSSTGGGSEAMVNLLLHLGQWFSVGHTALGVPPTYNDTTQGSTVAAADLAAPQ